MTITKDNIKTWFSYIDDWKTTELTQEAYCKPTNSITTNSKNIVLYILKSGAIDNGSPNGADAAANIYSLLAKIIISTRINILKNA